MQRLQSQPARPGLHVKAERSRRLLHRLNDAARTALAQANPLEISPGLPGALITVLINRPPQIVGLAADLDEHLVEVPLVAWAGPTAS